MPLPPLLIRESPDADPSAGQRGCAYEGRQPQQSAGLVCQPGGCLWLLYFASTRSATWASARVSKAISLPSPL
jgi:hypothetical protein